MPSSEAIRLRHMREAAGAALELANGRERLDLSGNLMLAMAPTRCLEILGEAASKIGPANNWGQLGAWAFHVCRNPQSLDKEMEYLARAESLGSGLDGDHAFRGGL